MREAVDMLERVAKEDFGNLPYWSKHLLGNERPREKGRTWSSWGAAPLT